MLFGLKVHSLPPYYCRLCKHKHSNPICFKMRQARPSPLNTGCWTLDQKTLAEDWKKMETLKEKQKE